MTQEIDHIPVIMAYPDNGYSPDELNEFVKAVLAFRIETAEQYKGKTIRYYFLPEGQIQMLEEAKNGAE